MQLVLKLVRKFKASFWVQFLYNDGVPLREPSRGREAHHDLARHAHSVGLKVTVATMFHLFGWSFQFLSMR